MIDFEFPAGYKWATRQKLLCAVRGGESNPSGDNNPLYPWVASTSALDVLRTPRAIGGCVEFSSETLVPFAYKENTPKHTRDQLVEWACFIPSTSKVVLVVFWPAGGHRSQDSATVRLELDGFWDWVKYAINDVETWADFVISALES